MRSSLKCFYIAVFATALAGCMQPSFNLKIEPSNKANKGQPFYIFIKHNTQNNYLQSDYNSLYQDYDQGKIKQRILVYPQKSSQYWTLKKPNNGGMSIYFLFQNSKKSKVWKVYLPPRMQKNITIKVSSNNSIKYDLE